MVLGGSGSSGTTSAPVVTRATQQRCNIFQQRIVLLDVIERRFAGECLDAAHAGCHAALAHDLEESDVAGAPHVRAAAELQRKVANLQNANVLVVLFPEQRHRACGHRAVIVHDVGLGGGVETDLRVHQALDLM